MQQYDRTRSLACFGFGVLLSFMPRVLARAAVGALLNAVAISDTIVGVAVALTYGVGAVGLVFLVCDRRS